MFMHWLGTFMCMKNIWTTDVASRAKRVNNLGPQTRTHNSNQSEVLQQTIHQTICSKIYMATQSKSKLSTKIQCSLQCLSLQCPNQNVQKKTVPSSPWQSQPAIMPDTTWLQRSASSGFLHVQPESSSGHETTRHKIIKSLNDREINATTNSQQSIHQQSYQQWTDWTLWQLRTRLIVIRTPRTMNYNLSGKYSRQQKSIHQTTSD